MIIHHHTQFGEKMVERFAVQEILSGHNRTHGQNYRRTDRQTDGMIPIYPPNSPRIKTNKQKQQLSVNSSEANERSVLADFSAMANGYFCWGLGWWSVIVVAKQLQFNSIIAILVETVKREKAMPVPPSVF